MKKYIYKIILISIVAILIDQISKIVVLKYLYDPYTSKTISIIGDFFKLEYSENFGIAFSIPIPFIILIIANLFLLTIIATFSVKELNIGKALTRYSLAMIIGGGISNLIDRVYNGFVVDFISIGPWPIFNIADIFITVGVLLLIVFYGKIKGPYRTQK